MSDTPHSPDQAIAIVAIGASAGGLEQIKLLLKHLPTDTGAAFVVLQHLDPHHESHLTELLAQASNMPTVTLEGEMPLQADRVYILPPGRRPSIDTDGVVHLVTSQAREAKPTLIDGFCRDLATTHGRNAVGIILSGNGSDGALGLKAIRGSGGLAMAQNADSAEFDGMPRAAAQHASPDCLLDTADMIAPLCNYLRANLGIGAPGPQSGGTESDDNVDEQTLTTVLDTLHEYCHYDFRHHKISMLKRRLQRRMALDGVASAQTYMYTLRNNEDERTRLCSDFLISVTDFFREPDSYQALNQSVVRRLMHNRSVDDPIRVWVPGCATGEEAYSIAMLLAEAIEASGRNYKFIVFATDIDDAALASARSGLYPDSIEADLSVERLRRFFDKAAGHYQIKRNLREHVVFAPQSVTDDPPYSRLDLISCRNLLIYLNATTQKRLIKLFHFALKESGFLFLGGSETVGDQTDLFEPVSKSNRIYHRLATNRHYHVDFPTPHGTHETPTYANTRRHSASQTRDAAQIARDVLLAEHVPASVLINRKLEILCSYGPTRDYLALPLGQSSLALLDMVRSEYRSHLRAVTHRAFRDDEQSDITTNLHDSNGQTVLISARPLRQPEQAHGLVLVTFEQASGASSARLKDLSTNDLEQELAEELDATRNELNGTIAALEESNEDLKGSNEEIMSMNEELQSTNEELETSKEELQSVNEELTTVNSELEAKVGELESAHDDLANLFSGTQVAILFLDRTMCIKRFTPAISALLNLLSSDIGRPLRDMTLKFNDPELLTDADKVLDELTPRYAEVQTADAYWYKRSILPYRTRDDVISGVVITFTDITTLKNTMLTAREHEKRLDLAVGALAGGMWEMRLDNDAPNELPDVIHISTRLKNLLGFTDAQMPDSLQAWSERVIAGDRAHFGDIARRQSEADRPLHYRIRHRDGSIRWFASYARLLSDEHGNSMRWIGIDCDITDYKQSEIRAQQTRAQLTLLMDSLPQMVAFITPDNSIRYANHALCDWLDDSAGNIIGHGLDAVLGADTLASLKHSLDTAHAGTAVSRDLRLRDRNNRELTFQVDHIPHIDDSRVLGVYLLMADTTSRKTPGIMREQDQTRLAYVHRMAMIGEMASTLAHDLNQPLSAINNYTGALTRMLHAGKPADDTVPVVGKIADQVERTSHIVTDVRDFVGGRQDGYEPLDLNELLQRALALTAGRARKFNVDTQVSSHTTLPATSGDRVQLQQVLINLINNAIDVMQDTDNNQRTLWLSTQAPDATHVQVAVADSGPGIAAGHLESVFESFQSTKLNGMGMGLAISRTIAEWHQGQLWAESPAGRGATFYLRLPVANADSDDLT